MSAYKLSKWVHPTTGEVRIYVNGGSVKYGDKLYIVADTNPDHRETWTAKLWAKYPPDYARLGLGRLSLDIALGIAEKALNERGLETRGPSQVDFVGILASVEG